MTTARDQLLALHDDPNRFDLSPDDLLPLQIAAVNERLADLLPQIPLLRNRADSAGLASITTLDDLVPLLLAHNTYKSYNEAWLGQGQWPRMARWLQTVSTYEADGSTFDGVTDIDSWIAALEETGQYVACSSGTTGKPAMLAASDFDVDFISRGNVNSFAWATGVAPANDRRFYGLGPRTNVTRNERIREMLVNSFGSPDMPPYHLPLPMITNGAIMSMILLRRKITDGTATASEVAEFERLSTERSAGMSDAMADAVSTLVTNAGERMFLSGMWASLYPLAMGVRAAGLDPSAFGTENTLLTGGGLKGATLPPDYREVVLETFGITEERVYHLYSMQELNTPFPRCRAGRYHVAPWVIVLPLDAPGEQLLDMSTGEVEGRAAFFDLALDARWGGIISGDRVSVDRRPCACGHQGPTIGPDIVRYAELDGGDKITCAGTIDAYVSGAS